MGKKDFFCESKKVNKIVINISKTEWGQKTYYTF